MLLGGIAPVRNNMFRSLVAIAFIIFFEIYATTTHSRGDEFSINCGLNLNFSEKMRVSFNSKNFYTSNFLITKP